MRLQASDARHRERTDRRAVRDEPRSSPAPRARRAIARDRRRHVERGVRQPVAVLLPDAGRKSSLSGRAKRSRHAARARISRVAQWVHDHASRPDSARTRSPAPKPCSCRCAASRAERRRARRLPANAPRSACPSSAVCWRRSRARSRWRWSARIRRGGAGSGAARGDGERAQRAACRDLARSAHAARDDRRRVLVAARSAGWHERGRAPRTRARRRRGGRAHGATVIANVLDLARLAGRRSARQGRLAPRRGSDRRRARAAGEPGSRTRRHDAVCRRSARLVRRRCRADRAGAHEPARERREIHARRQPYRDRRGSSLRSESGRFGDGRRPGLAAGAGGTDLRQVLPRRARDATGRRRPRLAICKAIVEAHGGRICGREHPGRRRHVPLQFRRTGRLPARPARPRSGRRDRAPARRAA